MTLRFEARPSTAPVEWPSPRPTPMLTPPKAEGIMGVEFGPSKLPLRILMRPIYRLDLADRTKGSLHRTRGWSKPVLHRTHYYYLLARRQRGRSVVFFLNSAFWQMVWVGDPPSSFLVFRSYWGSLFSGWRFWRDLSASISKYFSSRFDRHLQINKQIWQSHTQISPSLLA